MGLADGVRRIAVIENLSPQGADICGVAHVTRLLGLSAAVYTAAGASHNLNEMVICLAGFDFIEQLSGVAQAGGHRYLYLHAGHIVGGLLDALGSPDLGEVKLWKLLAGQGLHSGTEGCLHHAAGSAEDNAGAGAEA